MKILFLKQNTNPRSQIDQAVAWHKAHFPNTVFEIEERDIQITLAFDGSFGINKDGKKHGLIGAKEQVRQFVKEGEADVVVFLYHLDTYKMADGEVWSWTTWNPLYQGTEWCEIHVTPEDAQIEAGYKGDWTYVTITHELMHAYCKRLQRRGEVVIDEMDVTNVKGIKISYYVNDPDVKESNFTHTLDNLSAFNLDIPKVKPMYKYFKASEVIGLLPDFVAKLDRARGFAGVPFIITSGKRTAAQNKEAGGVSDSSHLSGEAVDLLVKDDASRYKIVSALLAAQFNRIGIYKSHIHVDCSKTLPQNVMWYKSTN